MNNIDGILYAVGEIKDFIGNQQLDLITNLEDERGNKYLFYPAHARTIQDEKIIAFLREWEEYKDEVFEERDKARVFVKKLKELIE